MKRYLFNSTAYFDKPDDQGGDPEAARKAAIEAERAKVQVTKVVAAEDDDDKEEVEKEEKVEDEQKEEDGEQETEKEDKEEIEVKDDKDDDKEKKRLQRQYDRTAEKLKLEAQERRKADKRVKELEAALAADPDKSTLTEADVEARAEHKARIKELGRTADSLGDGAQKLLKMSDNQWNAMVKDVTDDIGNMPAEVVEILGDLDNGANVVAHLFKNVDEAEDIYKLRDKPAKLGLKLAQLSAKLATPKPKKISQVPDPVEPLGGKPVQSDRLRVLSDKKNKTAEEMAEWVQARNADVEAKRKAGRHNLR